MVVPGVTAGPVGVPTGCLDPVSIDAGTGTDNWPVGGVDLAPPGSALTTGTGTDVEVDVKPLTRPVAS